MTVSIDNEKIRKVILQHYLQPVCHYDSDKFEYDYFFSNERRLKNACMDKVNIYLKLANDCVAKIGFNGTACAITSACADI
jgi:NifU-like protein involved in Fe-S cluster formation